MIEWMQQLLNQFIGTLMKVLPHSPFQRFIKAFDLPFLSTLNWVIPIGAIIKVTIVWCGVIAVWYVWSVVMRWVKLIGD